MQTRALIEVLLSKYEATKALWFPLPKDSLGYKYILWYKDNTPVSSGYWDGS